MFALQSLFHIAIQIHAFALERGLLIRGAITKGSLPHEGNVILGKALNKAVFLEENIENKIFDNDLNKRAKEKWEWLAKKFNDYLMSSKMQEKYHVLKTIEPIKSLNRSIYKQLLDFLAKGFP